MTTVSTAKGIKISKLPTFVQDKAKRYNIKSKRRRNLFKKIIEFKRLCGQQICFVVVDPEQNRHFVYNSCPSTFSANSLTKLLQEPQISSQDMSGKQSTQWPQIDQKHLTRTQFFKDEDYVYLKNDTLEGSAWQEEA